MPNTYFLILIKKIISHCLCVAFVGMVKQITNTRLVTLMCKYQAFQSSCWDGGSISSNQMQGRDKPFILTWGLVEWDLALLQRTSGSVLGQVFQVCSSLLSNNCSRCTLLSCLQLLYLPMTVCITKKWFAAVISTYKKVYNPCEGKFQVEQINCRGYAFFPSS